MKQNQLVEVEIQRDRRRKDKFIGKTWDGKVVFFSKRGPKRFKVDNRDVTSKQIATVKVISEKENKIIGAIHKPRLQSYIMWDEYTLDSLQSIIIENEALSSLMHGSSGKAAYPSLAFAFWSEMRSPTPSYDRPGGRKPIRNSLIYDAVLDCGKVSPNFKNGEGEYENVPKTLKAIITYEDELVWSGEFANPLLVDKSEMQGVIEELENLAKSKAETFSQVFALNLGDQSEQREPQVKASVEKYENVPDAKIFNVELHLN